MIEVVMFGFINNPVQRRDALLNKVDAFEKMLAVNNTQGAINKLQFDIEDKINKWLVVYNVTSPLQYTKPQIISLIENIISRLESLT